MNISLVRFKLISVRKKHAQMKMIHFWKQRVSYSDRKMFRNLAKHFTEVFQKGLLYVKLVGLDDLRDSLLKQILWVLFKVKELLC